MKMLKSHQSRSDENKAKYVNSSRENRMCVTNNRTLEQNDLQRISSNLNKKNGIKIHISSSKNSIKNSKRSSSTQMNY